MIAIAIRYHQQFFIHDYMVLVPFLKLSFSNQILCCCYQTCTPNMRHTHGEWLSCYCQVCDQCLMFFVVGFLEKHITTLMHLNIMISTLCTAWRWSAGFFCFNHNVHRCSLSSTVLKKSTSEDQQLCISHTRSSWVSCFLQENKKTLLDSCSCVALCVQAVRAYPKLCSEAQRIP